jgi:hypothetical protein
MLAVEKETRSVEAGRMAIQERRGRGFGGWQAGSQTFQQDKKILNGATLDCRTRAVLNA